MGGVAQGVSLRKIGVRPQIQEEWDPRLRGDDFFIAGTTSSIALAIAGIYA